MLTITAAIATLTLVARGASLNKNAKGKKPNIRVRFPHIAFQRPTDPSDLVHRIRRRRRRAEARPRPRPLPPRDAVPAAPAAHQRARAVRTQTPGLGHATILHPCPRLAHHRRSGPRGRPSCVTDYRSVARGARPVLTPRRARARVSPYPCPGRGARAPFACGCGSRRGEAPPEPDRP